MWKEFKQFAMKGNIIDLAIGLIIGGAFQKIVSSLVNDIVMPIISIFTGKVDFSTWTFNIGEVSIKFGAFITTIVDFLAIALTIFLIFRYIRKLNKKLEDGAEHTLKKLERKGIFKRKKKAEEPKPAPTTQICPFCFKEIDIKATRCPYCTSVIENVEKE